MTGADPDPGLSANFRYTTSTDMTVVVRLGRRSVVSEPYLWVSQPGSPIMVDNEALDAESLRAVALTMTCPRCGTPAGATCKWHGKFQTNLHPERLSMAAGGPNRDGLPPVPWRQSPDPEWVRSDPTIRRRVAASVKRDKISGGRVRAP